VVGVAYIIIFESLLANFDFIVRRLTVVFYFRVLSERWLELGYPSWSIDLSRAPGAIECVLTLLIVSFVAATLGAWLFAGREYRMKTSEGR
jgi:hypothetical protein